MTNQRPKWLLATALVMLAMTVNVRADTLALMPWPASIARESGELALSGAWQLSSRCDSEQVAPAFERFDRDVLRRTGAVPGTQPKISLRVRCERSKGFDAMDGETYSLSVALDGVRIDAAGAMGVLRAFATLRQLISMHSGEPTIPLVSIQDAPRFRWRGIMLDVARHFIEVSTIERQIDAMERMKLNVLHLHLSDDQAFRVESKRLPKLHTVGSHGQYFTQEQVRHLVAYAVERGVMIVPEFDVPGHSRAIIEAHPEIGATAARSRPPFPPDVALNPAIPRTYRFLRTLFEEMAQLFPAPYFHIGGDEVSDTVWADNSEIEAWAQREKLDSKRDIESHFARRVIDIVRAAGKTPIGWEEIAATEIPKEAIVHAWQSSNVTASATAQGHRTIVSAGYYLDLLMPADFHYAIDPLDTSAAGFTPAEAERIRKLNPLFAQMLTDAQVTKPLPALTAQQARLVLGAEAALWGELVTDEMVDHRLWPRAAALAERFWSPANVRDPTDMYRRLAVVHDQLTMSGLEGKANRRRMIARLAPGDAQAVRTLLDIVTPVRNMARDHRIVAAARGQIIEQQLNTLADAAPADSLVAQQFIDEARRFASGESELAPALRSQLAIWRENDARFAAIANGKAMLEPALPTSASIAALAQIGFEAVNAIERQANGAEQSWDVAEKLLASAEAHDAASRLPLVSFIGSHPPADLIIAITPGIRTLVNAARQLPMGDTQVGMIDQPCTALPPMPDSVREFNEAFLQPGKPDLLRMLALTRRPEFVAYNAAKKARDARDWAGLCRYRDENAAIIASGDRPDVVFLGDSITENWVNGDPQLFSSKRVGRGIGGQTSAQMLLRFHGDVISLRPRVVHIMAGTNDIAGNAGPTSERAFQDNIAAMVELARAHRIRVVLASIPPAAKFMWRPQLKPVEQIIKLNNWLREYAVRERLDFVDYHAVLATTDGGLKPELSIDGVHPNRDGYAAMRSLAEQACTEPS